MLLEKFGVIILFYNNNLYGDVILNYLSTPFFSGITKSEYEMIAECFNPEIRRYNTGNTICSFDGHSNFVGIVRSGKISIYRNDINGIRTVLETLSGGGIFGEIFYRANNSCLCNSISVICEKDCEIMFIDYRKIVGRCEKACPHHTKIVENMLAMLARKTVDLSERIDILSRRTTREKLLSYFTFNCKSGKHKFTLPFSYSSLAEYLCVDRSAMMREIKKLKNEGIIDTKKREISVLKEAEGL